MQQPRTARRLAWWLPLVAVWVVGASAPGIEHGLGLTRALAFSMLLGVAAGAAWYRLHPRTLANRLTPWAILAVLFVLFAAVVRPDEMLLADDPTIVCLVGILVGLVLTEQWVEGRAERRAVKAVKALKASRTGAAEPVASD